MDFKTVEEALKVFQKDPTLFFKTVEEALKVFQKDPTLFFKTVLGSEPEEYQMRILEAIALHDRIAVSACHDVGKSWTLARVVLWFASCFPHCKVVTTAPTGRQVELILWSEINAAYASSKVPLGGRMLTTKWSIDKEWFAVGFSPQKSAGGGKASDGQGTDSSFQGFHAKGGILVVFDEATGINQSVWTMAEGLLTQSHVKFVCIGNPTSTQSEFYNCFKSREWHKIKLSCFDSPNMIANGLDTMDKLRAEVELLKTLGEEAYQARVNAYKIVKSYLLSPKWVVARLIKWGFEHPLSLSKILGEFPTESENVQMPMSMVEAAMQRVPPETSGERLLFGVDIARYGTDSTVITILRGFKFLGKITLSKRDLATVTGAVMRAIGEYGMPDIICLDETGLGAGVVDFLRENQAQGLIDNTVEIRGINFGAGLTCELEDCQHRECDKGKFVNQKAKMYDCLARDLKSDLCLPENEEVYLEELPTILYEYDSKGRLYIESKDDYKKRTGKGSPDHADSLALANYGRDGEIGVGLFSHAFFEGIAKPMTAALRGGSNKWQSQNNRRR